VPLDQCCLTVSFVCAFCLSLNAPCKLSVLSCRSCSKASSAARHEFDTSSSYTEVTADFCCCVLQVPLYLSEIAPPRWRGTLNLLFQCFCIFGILAAACINYGTVRTHWGWRLSLGLAAVPAVVLGVGALFLPDSPNSLVFRGKVEQARKVLEGYRGEQGIVLQLLTSNLRPSPHLCCMLSCQPLKEAPCDKVRFMSVRRPE